MTTTETTYGRGRERLLLFVEAAVGLAVVGAVVGGAYGAFPTVTFLLCAVAVAFTGWVLTQMFAALGDPTLDVGGRVRDREREQLEGEKRLLLQGIKDLEVDHAVGKMNVEQYQDLRATAEARAVEIIRKLRESDTRWTREAEALVAARLGGVQLDKSQWTEPDDIQEIQPKPPTRLEGGSQAALADFRLFDDRPTPFRAEAGKLVCEACGFKNDPDARFCAGCGRPLEEQAA